VSSSSYLIVTSINAPNPVLRALSTGARASGFRFCVIGDVPSPTDFHIDGCEFYGIQRQLESGFEFAQVCPTRHYARKNIGYLIAIRGGAEIILETDDDNFPRDGFWAARQRRQVVPSLSGAGWVNVLGWFTDTHIWPRGLPLDLVQEKCEEKYPWAGVPVAEADCPIQMGLADENPDVDAVYRLVLPLPVSFRTDRRVALGAGTWSPFNSQNTAWWPDAYPLLYLPAYCSFRATDIWRSLVAQRVAWEHGWQILYHEPTVWQERNEHNLMRDFEQEVPVYLHNRKIAGKLESLALSKDAKDCGANLRICYEAIVGMGLIDPRELELVDAWLGDLR